MNYTSEVWVIVLLGHMSTKSTDGFQLFITNRADIERVCLAFTALWLGWSILAIGITAVISYLTLVTFSILSQESVFI